MKSKPKIINYFLNHFYFNCLNGKNKILTETTMQRIKDLNYEKYFISNQKYPKNEIASSNYQVLNFLLILRKYNLQCKSQLFQSLPVNSCFEGESNNITKKLENLTFNQITYKENKIRLDFREDINNLILDNNNHLTEEEYNTLKEKCTEGNKRKMKNQFITSPLKLEDVFTESRLSKEDFLLYNNDEIWIWTDGSSVSKKTINNINENNTPETMSSWAAYTKQNSIFNSGGRTNEIDTSIQAELEAIEYTLNKIPIGSKVKIFTDCKPAILLSTTEQDLDSGKILRNRHIAIIRRIKQMRIKLKELQTEIIFEWIPSHIEEKLNNYEDDPIKVDKLHNYLKLLNEKYPNKIQTIIGNNETVDKLAKSHLEDKKNYRNPKGINIFAITNIETKIETGDIGKKIKEFQQENFKKIWFEHTYFNKSSFIDTETSNYMIKENHKLSPFLIKLRNKQLNGCKEMQWKIRKHSDDFTTNRLKALYPDSKCPFCNSNNESTLHIVGLCPKWQEMRDDIKDKVEDIIFNRTREIVTLPTWYLTLKDKNLNLNRRDARVAGSMGYFPKSIKRIIKDLVEDHHEQQEICREIQETIIKQLKLIYKTRCKEFWDLKKNLNIHPNILKKYNNRKRKM